MNQHSDSSSETKHAGKSTSGSVLGTGEWGEDKLSVRAKEETEGKVKEVGEGRYIAVGRRITRSPTRHLLTALLPHGIAYSHQQAAPPDLQVVVSSVRCRECSPVQLPETRGDT